jgi:hypothetical protein
MNEFALLMEKGDVEGLMRAWKIIAPDQHQPGSYEEAEISMHASRTAANSISFPKRAYSHAWLVERNIPSLLPDDLKPKAERLYPRIVAGVGISVNSHSSWLKPAAKIIQGAMCEAVEEVAADGKFNDQELVKRRMFEAKQKTQKALFGRWPLKIT